MEVKMDVKHLLDYLSTRNPDDKFVVIACNRKKGVWYDVSDVFIIVDVEPVVMAVEISGEEPFTDENTLRMKMHMS